VAAHVVAPLRRVFVDPAFGGMQVNSSTYLYPRERYVVQHEDGPEQFPADLEATRFGELDEDPKQLLLELSLGRRDPVAARWSAAAGLKLADDARLLLNLSQGPQEPITREAQSTLAVLVRVPELPGQYLSLFVGAPWSATWKIDSMIDRTFRLPKRILDVTASYSEVGAGEIHTRVESDTDLTFNDQPDERTGDGQAIRRRLAIQVGLRMSIRMSFDTPQG
jgi:hypothetical protein